MQTGNHNSILSVTQPTIIQVAKNNSEILQNGQHLLIGKLGIEQSNINSSNTNQPGNSSNNNMQTIYPIQYIETSLANVNPNQPTTDGTTSNIYRSTSNKIFYQDGHPRGIYANISGQTATIIPTSAIQTRDITNQLGVSVGSTLHIQSSPHTQIVHHGRNAYLVQNTGRIEEESPNVSHTTKASPVTIQWLCDNYETADGVSLPRSTLYNHYLQHCQQEKLEPMNQASFGKLIRSVFFGLRTRRLGTRGNSKYHYYGIRIKPNSILNHYVEDQTFAIRQYPLFHRQSSTGDNDFHWQGKYSTNGLNYGSTNPLNSTSINNSGSNNNNAPVVLMNNNDNSGNGTAGSMSDCGSGVSNGNNNQHSNYLGESSSALPKLNDIISRAEIDTLTEEECSNKGVTLEDINVFCQMYLDHNDAVLSAVVYLNFKYIESLWQEFWRTNKSQSNYLEDKLSKIQLYRLLKVPQIQNFLQLFDNTFYQSLVEVLIPNVLRPIPSALTQNIRHFAKSLESWMATAVFGLNSEVVRIKMGCVCSLAHTLRRHTSLNHLAQAARAVLKNANQISQMLTDLNRVDFTNVQEQASWVCGCDSKRVESLQQEFKRILQQQASLEEWATWLDHVVTGVLEPFKGTSQFANEAHKLILKWSFYSSMVIRDLTLRSAASFGSFHLIRLLYDEYIYYLVEQKVADHLNLTPVAVTGQMGRQIIKFDCSNNESIQLHSEREEESTTDIKKAIKFKVEPGIKKEVDTTTSSCPMKVSSDYDGIIQFNTGVLNTSCLVDITGAIESDYNRILTNNNINEDDSNQTGYNNSGFLIDDQVDESVDDDEGLDEEDFQNNEPLSITHLQMDNKSISSQSISLSQKKSDMSLSNSSNVVGQLVTNKPLIGGVCSNSVRKSVNVTTFGEPLSSSTPANLSGFDGMTNATDIPLTSLNKINIVNNFTYGIAALPANLTITSLKTSPNSHNLKPMSDSIVMPSSYTTGSMSLSTSTVSTSKRIKIVNNCCMSNNVIGSNVS